MKYKTAGKLFAYLCVMVFSLVSCKKDDPAWLIPPPPPDQSFVEEFDTVAAAFHRGWVPVNNSNPKGQSIWVQGGFLSPIFAPYSSKGSYAGFIGTDYLSTSAQAGVISNWLISPLIWMKNGDKISFYTRSQLYPVFNSTDSTDYGNNLEVCINKKNQSTDVGTARDPRDPLYDAGKDRGDFNLLLSINPPAYDAVNNFFSYRLAHSTPALYDPLAYPATWTRFEVTITGVDRPHKGRFAFRYYTLDAGSNGNGTAVAIDQVTFSSMQ